MEQGKQQTIATLTERVRKLEGSTPNRLVAKVGTKGLVALFVVVLMTGLAAGVTLTPLQNTPMGGWSSAFSGTNVHVISMETSVIDASTWEVVVKVENTDVVGHTVELTLSAIDSGGSTIFTDTRTVVLTWTPITETVTFILSAPDIVELTSKFALFLEQTV